jgi:transposase
VEVPLPDACPDCGGELELERVADQYQEDIPPVRPHMRQYRIAIGRCRCCGRRVQGRHPEQTSDALGAAAAQVGPRALAAAAQLNKELGLPVAKVARALSDLCGLQITPGGLQQALQRLAGAAGPTYDALIEGIRASPAVAADETGWRVGGRRMWLWDFVGQQITVYLIAPGRGYDQAAAVLGEDFAGVLERDGWAPYRRFDKATHQTCLAHLLCRCRELIADSRAGQARVPHAVRRILLGALALRDARDRGELPEAELHRRVAGLEARTDKLLAGRPSHPPNRTLLGHLRNERDHLFTFLTTPGVCASNWRAEQGLRPAVCKRKHWGGNRTWRGAETEQVLMSVIRSARQQEVDPAALLIGLQCEPEPSPAHGLRIPARPLDDQPPLADEPALAALP